MWKSIAPAWPLSLPIFFTLGAAPVAVGVLQSHVRAEVGANL
jgi:hypothetical protein